MDLWNLGLWIFDTLVIQWLPFIELTLVAIFTIKILLTMGESLQKLAGKFMGK